MKTIEQESMGKVEQLAFLILLKPFPRVFQIHISVDLFLIKIAYYCLFFISV